MSRTAPPAWRPTATQECLLRACLARGPQAVEAFEAWKARADMDRLDPASYRLLPLLWRNLSACGVDDPLLPTLKGLYRRTWYQNQLLLHRAAALVDSLQSAGIPAMLLKGAALCALWYRDAGVRPMNDIDVAVPTALAAAAVDHLFASGWAAESTPLKGRGAAALLAKVGWKRAGRRRSAFGVPYFFVRHAHGFTGPGGFTVDLHWHVFQERCDDEADADLWAAAVPLRLGHTETRALDPADQLLHVCAHAARWDEVPPIRWIADASAVLAGAGPDFPWERLSARARAGGFVLALGEMLGFLRERFAPEVPETVLRDLRQAPVSRRERRAHLARVLPPGVAEGLRELRYLWDRYRALRRDPARRHQLKGFPSFLRDILGVDHLWQIPVHAALEAARRLWRNLRG